MAGGLPAKDRTVAAGGWEGRSGGFGPRRSGSWTGVLAGVAALAVGAGLLRAGPIPVPNGSFESPATAFADPRLDSWQKSPKPVWYDESGGHLWDQLTGVFQNTAPTNAAYIDDMDKAQAAFLFALPQVALFQDYDSLDGTNSAPTHAFNARFEVGKAYTLTVGVIGGGGNMLEGVSLELSVYYRDSASNQVTVAATSITHRLEVFSNLTHFVDFSVEVPAVKAGDAWAGRHIGVQLLSTVSPDLAGGYWDVDNARLSEVSPPVLLGAARTHEGFAITLQSEPGLRFEILAAGDLALPPANWSRVGVVTNLTGAVPFFEPATNVNLRYYRARQLP